MYAIESGEQMPASSKDFSLEAGMRTTESRPSSQARQVVCAQFLYPPASFFWLRSRLHFLETHGLDEPCRLHYALQTDGRDVLLFPNVAREVLLRRIVDVSPRAHEVGHRFCFKLHRVDVPATAVRPPLVIRRTKVAAVKMGKLMDNGRVLCFTA